MSNRTVSVYAKARELQQKEPEENKQSQKINPEESSKVNSPEVDVMISGSQDITISKNQGTPLSGDSNGFYAYKNDLSLGKLRQVQKRYLDKLAEHVGKFEVARIPQMLRVTPYEKDRLNIFVQTLTANGYQTSQNEVLRIALLVLCEIEKTSIFDHLIERVLKKAGKFDDKFNEERTSPYPSLLE